MGLCIGPDSVEMLRVGLASGFPQKEPSFCVVWGVEYVGDVCLCVRGCVCARLQVWAVCVCVSIWGMCLYTPACWSPAPAVWRTGLGVPGLLTCRVVSGTSNLSRPQVPRFLTGAEMLASGLLWCAFLSPAGGARSAPSGGCLVAAAAHEALDVALSPCVVLTSRASASVSPGPGEGPGLGSWGQVERIGLWVLAMEAELPAWPHLAVDCGVGAGCVVTPRPHLLLS